MQPHSTHNDWYHWQRGSASTPLPTLPPVQSTSPSLLQSRYNPANHMYQPYGRPAPHPKAARPRLTTTLWEDESTMCYQVDSRGICVARRQDNDMINGTKLLNVAGMSRGKRDGILKNERGRIVVKVGAMHLKGVWIPLVRAKALANQFKIFDILHPIFSDDPGSFLYPSSSHFHQMNRLNSSTRVQNENHRLHYNEQPDTSTGSAQQDIVNMTGRHAYEPYYYSNPPSSSSPAQNYTSSDKSFW